MHLHPSTADLLLTGRQACDLALEVVSVQVAGIVLRQRGLVGEVRAGGGAIK